MNSMIRLCFHKLQFVGQSLRAAGTPWAVGLAPLSWCALRERAISQTDRAKLARVYTVFSPWSYHIPGNQNRAPLIPLFICLILLLWSFISFFLQNSHILTQILSRFYDISAWRNTPRILSVLYSYYRNLHPAHLLALPLSWARPPPGTGVIACPLLGFALRYITHNFLPTWFCIIWSRRFKKNQKASLKNCNPSVYF